jgi:hypothetical protein
MFEKKIKNFFNSVTVCGEFPKKKSERSTKLSASLKITASVACVLLGALLAAKLIDKVGEETADSM